MIYKAYIVLKMYLFHCFRLFRMETINRLSKGSKDLALNSDPCLEKQNALLQGQFSSLFREYSVCAACKSHCCDTKANRLDFNDCFLYGLSLKEGSSPKNEIGRLFISLAEAREYILQKNPHASKENCDYFSDAGCVLPAGKRPNTCVTYLCMNFLKKMEWRDAMEFSGLLNRNFFLHSKITFALIKSLNVKKGRLKA